MKRVVVTGIGIWSCIGQDIKTVTESLRNGRSGVIFVPERIERGLHGALVGNVPRPDLKPLLPRKFRTTMSEDAEYAYMAARQALLQSAIDEAFTMQNEVGIVWGNDGNTEGIKTADVLNSEHDALMIEGQSAFRNATSSAAMNLGTIFHLSGIRMGIAAACASSSHAIGLASLFIRNGMQKMILVGGSCEIADYGAMTVDSVGAVSLRNNDPTHASRPFDKGHDGMIQSGGAAALVLEEYEHAVARGATILAEVLGYGFSNNGEGEISMANREAEYIAMTRALADAGVNPADIDYVNAHATSTPQGDCEEAAALSRLFAHQKAWISSTKSMTGHEDWMAGASEAVYSILMMQNSFIAPNINLVDRIEEAKELNIATETIYQPVSLVLSNSLGMGGTNSALVFKRL